MTTIIERRENPVRMPGLDLPVQIIMGADQIKGAPLHILLCGADRASFFPTKAPFAVFPTGLSCLSLRYY